ncbi:MAG: polyprenol monophosphomannose synthase [Planctomycetes bacterium]|nr:polyprenol monophosphomannose synthase [Planctomycetota bacterium]
MIDVERRPTLRLVVPTLREAHGIEAFLAALLPVARALGAEVVVVDDRSEDGTADLARAAVARLGAADLARVVVRAGPRGLSASVLEGWAGATAPLLGVMDADLSHPPDLLPRLVEEVEAGADVAIASRYVPGGGVEGWPLRRRVVSRAASLLGRTVVTARDPLSGFFVLRREVIEGVALRPRGWKIALEVLARGRVARVAQVPFVFRDRAWGRSKFGPRAVVDFLAHLARLHADRLRRR